MKRRAWRRWTSEKARVPARRESKGAAEVTACPVCGRPLRVEWTMEEGPRGPERVRLLHCLNAECPRSRLGEGA